MDIEKLVEDGALKIRAALNFEGEEYAGCFCQADKCSEADCECLRLCREPSRAVLAIALAALERDALAEQQFSASAIRGANDQPKGGDANDSGPSRPIDATSPGVTAGAIASLSLAGPSLSLHHCFS